MHPQKPVYKNIYQLNILCVSTQTANQIREKKHQNAAKECMNSKWVKVPNRLFHIVVLTDLNKTKCVMQKITDLANLCTFAAFTETNHSFC
jgi:hypothetical protein